MMTMNIVDPDGLLQGYIELVAAIYRTALVDAVAPHDNVALREDAWAFFYGYYYDRRVPDVEALIVSQFARLGAGEREKYLARQMIPEDVRGIQDEERIQDYLDICLSHHDFEILVTGRIVTLMRPWSGDREAAIGTALAIISEHSPLEIEYIDTADSMLTLTATWEVDND